MTFRLLLLLLFTLFPSRVALLLFRRFFGFLFCFLCRSQFPSLRHRPGLPHGVFTFDTQIIMLLRCWRDWRLLTPLLLVTHTLILVMGIILHRVHVPWMT